LVLNSSSYTPLLSVVVSFSEANHLLYADNAQLLHFISFIRFQHNKLLSFSFLEFSYNITHLENTIANVSNWMSFNFLSLNAAKTESLTFGLPQPSRNNNPTIRLLNNVILSPVDSAHNLGVIFDKHLSFHSFAQQICCF